MENQNTTVYIRNAKRHKTMKFRKEAEQKPLRLKQWVYNENGESIKTLLKDSFSEFYLMRKFKE